MEQLLPKYVITPQEGKRLNDAFTYHAPVQDQPERYVHLRSLALSLAEQVMAMCPPSRERSLALTKIEEAVMWANASIARNE